jgi:hypothetical protein
MILQLSKSQFFLSLPPHLLLLSPLPPPPLHLSLSLFLSLPPFLSVLAALGMELRASHRLKCSTSSLHSQP